MCLYLKRVLFCFRDCVFETEVLLCMVRPEPQHGLGMEQAVSLLCKLLVQEDRSDLTQPPSRGVMTWAGGEQWAD